MLKILLVTLTILGVVAVSGIAWARYNGYCAGGDLTQRVTERVSRKLDLNEYQAAKLQGFAEKLQALRSGWSEGRNQIRGELEGLLAAPVLDRDRVTGLLDERHQALAERKGEIVDAFGDFSDSLEPGQRTRLAELITARLDHRWGGPPHGAH